MARPRVIVIGGSAGALDALVEILSGIPGELDVPVAVVVHLTPRRPSLMPEVVARFTGRRVCEPEDKQALEPRTIYVAPPNYHMLLERSGHIALSVDEPVHFSRPSIDVLFESAAAAFGPEVAGVVLSGTNEDGADGLHRIHLEGGTAIVQSPDAATYPLMPAAALRRTPEAAALATRDIPAFLANLVSPTS